MPGQAPKTMALKEAMTMVRDIVITIRDELPDVGNGAVTTANQRRAMRKAILKLLAVWNDMNDASDLPNDVKHHRTYAIDGMMRMLIRLHKVPLQEDGGDTDDLQDNGDRDDDAHHNH